jgi:hypothetical protein
MASGIDDEDENNKGRYKFLYSDFEKVHRCGLLAAESPAGQRKYYDIELARWPICTACWRRSGKQRSTTERSEVSPTRLGLPRPNWIDTTCPAGRMRAPARAATMVDDADRQPQRRNNTTPEEGVLT